MISGYIHRNPCVGSGFGSLPYSLYCHRRLNLAALALLRLCPEI